MGATSIANAGDPDYETVCAWWAKCPNPANAVRTHPVLGDVPICKRCADRLAELA